jgi:Spy/CpxP family protein refolding chaperone
MNKALIGILAATLTMAMVHDAMASPKGGKGMRGNAPRMTHMQESLGLSDAQVEQIRDIRANGGTRDDVRAVLSDEQREMMDTHRARRQGQRDGAAGSRKARDGGYRAGNAPADPPAGPETQ